MAVEIERKFLVANAPERGDLGRGTPIRQGYLAEEGTVAVRVRITDQQCVVTIKAGGAGLSRTEVEVEIERDEAEALWAHTEGRRVEKTRYHVDASGNQADLDEFGGRLDGLWLVEVEFDSEQEARDFEPPAWFGTEVTEDERW